MMGTMFYAVNHQSKKAVELGKSPLYFLAGPHWNSAEKLVQAIQEWLLANGSTTGPYTVGETAVFLAAELWHIGNVYDVITDQTCADDYVGYVITGSWYRDPRSRSYVGTPLADHIDG